MDSIVACRTTTGDAVLCYIQEEPRNLNPPAPILQISPTSRLLSPSASCKVSPEGAPAADHLVGRQPHCFGSPCGLRCFTSSLRGGGSSSTSARASKPCTLWLSSDRCCLPIATVWGVAGGVEGGVVGRVFGIVRWQSDLSLLVSWCPSPCRRPGCRSGSGADRPQSGFVTVPVACLDALSGNRHIPLLGKRQILS